LAFGYLHSSALLVLNASAALLCLLGLRRIAPLFAGAFEPDGMEPALPIAALKKRHESALRAKQAKCEFLANMGHQLRTPMNAVIGYSEMLLEDLFAAGQQNPELVKVHELGQLVLSRTNDVLDLAKMEMGRLPVFVETTTLQELSSTLASAFSAAAQRHENQCELRLAPSADLIAVDLRKTRQLVQQVFSVVNDVLQHGRILTTLRVADGHLACTVLGDADMTARARFQEIFHGDEPSDRFSVDGQTARLAMALSRQLSAVLGGHIALVEEDGAAGFVIELPAAGGHELLCDKASRHNGATAQLIEV